MINMTNLKWINKLNRKFGRFAISNLMFYIVATMLFVFILDFLLPDLGVHSFIYFDRNLIMQGQVWRIITFIFLPPNSSIVFIAFALYFYYWIGSSLEKSWGSFYFNVFYLCGILGTIIGGIITGYAVNYYLNLSLFLAFALLYPNEVIMLFFVIPVKVKFLGIINAVILAGMLIIGNFADKMSIVFAFLNIILFFFSDFMKIIKFKSKYYKTRRNFKVQMRNNKK